MIITKLNLDDLSELSIDIKEDSKPVDVIEMLKYLAEADCGNYIYINWDKHIYSKTILSCF